MFGTLLLVSYMGGGRRNRLRGSRELDHRAEALMRLLAKVGEYAVKDAAAKYRFGLWKAGVDAELCSGSKKFLRGIGGW